MKFLADENIHGGIVDWLRAGRHDVVWASESMQGASDPVLPERARREQRVLLTSDLDFGELVFQQRLVGEGVVLSRIEGLPVKGRIRRLKAAWSIIEANPSGAFVVVTPRKVRVRKLPDPT